MTNIEKWLFQRRLLNLSDYDFDKVESEARASWDQSFKDGPDPDKKSYYNEYPYLYGFLSASYKRLLEYTTFLEAELKNRDPELFEK